MPRIRRRDRWQNRPRVRFTSAKAEGGHIARMPHEHEKVLLSVVLPKRQILDAQVAFHLLKGTNVVCDYRHRHHSSASFSLVEKPHSNGSYSAPEEISLADIGHNRPNLSETNAKLGEHSPASLLREWTVSGRRTFSACPPERITYTLGGGWQIPFLIAGCGGHGPIEKLSKTCSGATVPVPDLLFDAVQPPAIAVPKGDSVEVVAYNDNNFGFLRITVDANQKILFGELNPPISLRALHLHLTIAATLLESTSS